MAVLNAALAAGTLVYMDIGAPLAPTMDAAANIYTAIAALEQRVTAVPSIVALQQLLATAILVDGSYYTWDTFESLENAITVAQDVVANTDRTALSVVDAEYNITSAIFYLVRADSVDRSLLLTAIVDADARINPPVPMADRLWYEHWYTQFTRLSWHQFLPVRAEAHALYNNRLYDGFTIDYYGNLTHGEFIGTRNFSQRDVDEMAARLSAMGLLSHSLADEREDLRNVLDRLIAVNRIHLSPEEIVELDEAIFFGEDRYIYASLTFVERDGVISTLTAVFNRLHTLEITRIRVQSRE
jgi:hypothetical protein